MENEDEARERRRRILAKRFQKSGAAAGSAVGAVEGIAAVLEVGEAALRPLATGTQAQELASSLQMGVAGAASQHPTMSASPVLSTEMAAPVRTPALGTNVMPAASPPSAALPIVVTAPAHGNASASSSERGGGKSARPVQPITPHEAGLSATVPPPTPSAAREFLAHGTPPSVVVAAHPRDGERSGDDGVKSSEAQSAAPQTTTAGASQQSPVFAEAKSTPRLSSTTREQAQSGDKHEVQQGQQEQQEHQQHSGEKAVDGAPVTAAGVAGAPVPATPSGKRSPAPGLNPREALRERLRMTQTRRMEKKQLQTPTVSGSHDSSDDDDDDYRRTTDERGKADAGPGKLQSTLSRLRARRTRKELGEKAPQPKRLQARDSDSDDSDEEARNRRSRHIRWNLERRSRLPTAGVPWPGARPAMPKGLHPFMPESLLSFLQRPVPLLPVGLAFFQHATGLNEKAREGRNAVADADVTEIRILEADFSAAPDVVQPMVKVHVIDGTTGRYLRTDREAGNAKEDTGAQQGGKKDTDGPAPLEQPTGPPAPPVATLPFPLPGSSCHAKWHQRLVVDVPYRRALLRPEALLLFEVLEQVAELSTKKNRRRVSMRRVAWAFMRVVDLRGSLNVPTDLQAEDSTHQHTPHSVLQLQLYRYQALGPVGVVQASCRGLFEASASPAAAGKPRSTDNITSDPSISITAGGVPSVYLQYLLRHHQKHPAALVVSLHPTKRAPVALRLKVSRLERQGSEALPTEGVDGGEEKCAAQAIMEHLASSTEASQRRRDPFEPCLLPLRLLYRIRASSQGALCIRFSNAGRQLAVACCSEPWFYVRIFDVETGRMQHDLRPLHSSVIHDVSWSADDRYIATASADGTARVWRVNAKAVMLDEDGLPTVVEEENKAMAQQSATLNPSATENGATQDAGERRGSAGDASTASAADMRLPRAVSFMQHSPPCYVYSVIFPSVGTDVGASETTEKVNPGEGEIITGAYDCALHMWDVTTGKLLGLLGGKHVHANMINALAHDRRSGRVYSGDGDGVIIAWKRTSARAHPSSYQLLQRLAHPDFIGRPITSLALHPTRRKGQLLALSHQNVLRLIDLYTYRLVNPGYVGVCCKTTRIRTTFSADGRYVVAGGEDGKLRVWETQSGKAVLGDGGVLGYPYPLCDVAWHPSQHVIAMAAYGEDMPVLMYWAKRDDESRGDGIEEGEGQGAKVPTDKKKEWDVRLDQPGLSTGYPSRRASAEERILEKSRRAAKIEELKSKWMSTDTRTEYKDSVH